MTVFLLGPIGRICRVCHHPECNGGRTWHEPDLCSHCAARQLVAAQLPDIEMGEGVAL